MILKSYIVEQNIEVLNGYQGVLIHGKNHGIKDDVKKKIRNKNKNSEIIIFFEEEILKEKNILYQSVVNESLFWEKRVIFIQEATDKIFHQITECLGKENKNVQIYIFSENLEKKSKLRNLFEKKKTLAIFACYEDNERTLIAYVNKELQGFKGLSGEITNLIIYNSNMDRRAIKNELVKIKNFFLEKKIHENELLEILNIKDNTSFDEIRDYALNGEKRKINKLLSEIDIVNEETFFYLNNLNYRILKLKEIIMMSGNNKNKYEQNLENLKPPIFWKDKPVVIKQLEKWNLKELTQMTVKIGKIEILMKKNSHIRNDIIIKDLIVNLTNKASSIFS